MALQMLDRETLIDLTVNAIPLAIILFFIVLFTVINPWGLLTWEAFVGQGLLVVPFVLLALLSYVAGRAIARAEGRVGRGGR